MVEPQAPLAHPPTLMERLGETAGLRAWWQDRTVDFTRIRPRFVNYERVLLHDDEAACRAMMVSAGYVLFDFGQDTLCVAVSER